MESPSHEDDRNLLESYLRFRMAAQGLTRLLDNLDAIPVSSFLKQLRTGLLELYASALALPDVDPDTDTSREAKPAQVWSVYQRVDEKLGDAGRYWEVFDPTIEDKPVRASIADDLSDIQSALGDLFVLEEGGASVTELVFEARLAFRIHWWEHAVGAIRALHWILHNRFGDD